MPGSLLIAVASVLLILLAAMTYLRWYLRWEAAQTGGMLYYGKPLRERRALKRRIHKYSRPVVPLVNALGWANRARLTLPSFEYRGVYGPAGIASPAVFERAAAYAPRVEDVFVVTQMRCGTTWMQQLAFQIATRGRGDLSDQGFGHLYAMSPWIDASITVSMEDAPLVGDSKIRIIKSHLPTLLCPYGSNAKYIYVTRHPVSCFASIVDYNRSLLGPLTPPIETLAAWFCSDRMYWLPWPRHTAGWWEWAQTRDNVLFVHYEEMTRDFAGVLNRVARFLSVELSADERQVISRKCSFQYMKEHEELFEMAAPTMFSVAGGAYLKSGKEMRHEDVTPTIRDQILDYCRRAIGDDGYPAGRFYRDLSSRGSRTP